MKRIILSLFLIFILAGFSTLIFAAGIKTVSITLDSGQIKATKSTSNYVTINLTSGQISDIKRALPSFSRSTIKIKASFFTGYRIKFNIRGSDLFSISNEPVY